MKKLIALMTIILLLPVNVMAEEGEMGHMGGISSGMNLPKTIDKVIGLEPATSNTYIYKEVVFLGGEPIVFSGELTVNKDISDVQDDEFGSYTESYSVTASSGESNSLSRSISYTMDYRVVNKEFKKQVVPTLRDGTLSWSETITTADQTYVLDADASSYTYGGITHVTPGIEFFNSDISYVAVYNYGEGNTVTVETVGTNVGYNQPWSKIENQTRNMTITYSEDGKEDMSVDTESFLEAKKTLYYAETQPFPISFDGTYNQRYQRESTMTYKINTYHPNLDSELYTGSAVVTTANQIEKLPIPDNLSFIEGHWAEEDIKKLYSMEIFTDLPHQGMQYEAISRGDYIKALCYAMNLDISARESSDEVIFGDVPPEHPLYPYIMTAYDKKLIKGTGENFDVGRPINREEAFVVYIRIIGLEEYGVTEAPVTPFVDDNQISDWAKKEIMAGYRLGIIQGDTTGAVNPKQWISKSEAAAIINRLIDYLREDIGQDYRK